MILAPSILAADLSRLGEELRAVERGGAGLVHVDVMDGRFVPNLSLGPVVVEAVRRSCALPPDVHLMVDGAERYIDAFVDAGAASLSVHVEAVTHLQRAIERIRSLGVRPGVALNPSTPLVALEEILPEVDFVLVLSVNPGFAGQRFLPSALVRIRRLRATIRERSLAVRIQVDGGVHRGNVRDVVAAGAEIIVAGAAAFADGDPEAASRALLAAASASEA